MIRITRPWQGLGLLLGLTLSLPLLSGQGCPTTSEEVLDSNTTGSTDTSSSVTQTTDEPAEQVAQTKAQVIYPNGGEQIEVGSIVDIRVFARHTDIPNPVLRVFYDRDNDPTNGDTTIGTIKASAGGLGWNTAGLGTGKYFVGAEIAGQTTAVRDYSDAAFSLIPAGTTPGGDDPDPNNDTDLLLTVSAPRNQINTFSSHTFTIRWSTNLLPGEGTATVYREPDFDEDGVPDGHALRDVIGYEGIDASDQQLDFNMAGVVGNFFIVVTVEANDGRVASAYSTGTLNIQAPVFWLGGLASQIDSTGKKIRQTGSFQGAIMHGTGFQDNLGSAMTALGDQDGDGVDEIVMAAQFAKPFFLASEGRGAGEAYMIYGDHDRLYGDYDVNTVGQEGFEGLTFTGIVPNPHGNLEEGGNKLAFTVDGDPTEAFSTEGLRSLTVIPDQDNDGKEEIVFGFPWCDSYSLLNQILDGFNPSSLNARLENNGHFLRGGMVVVSSVNPLMSSRKAISRHGDRVMMLHEVGQVFSDDNVYSNQVDLCPYLFFGVHTPNDGLDTVTYPCDGFWQRTDHKVGYSIDPPRLADPLPAYELAIPDDGTYACNLAWNFIDTNQIDSPAVPTSMHYFYGRNAAAVSSAGNYCTSDFYFERLGLMRIIGTGFRVTNHGSGDPTSCATQRFSDPIQPYGARILGQTTTQLNTTPPTTANRFAASLSTSGTFLAIGAPRRTALQRDVTLMPEASRDDSGEIYLLQLRRSNTSTREFPWHIPSSDGSVNFSPGIPQPHNYIIDDVGYTRWLDADFGQTDCGWIEEYSPGEVYWEMNHPIRVVGANAKDRIGDSVQGLYDVNNDGVEDLLVGGAGTNSGRGAVYVLYRRQAELENDYLLDRLQLDPADTDRLNGLYIVGEPGENLGTSLGGLGPKDLKDDYNNDGFPDALIGSPNAATANGYDSGEVFILLGGKNTINPKGGVTLNQLRTDNKGVLLIGANAGNRAGETVASAGDINGDGYPDILIAAPKATVPDIKFKQPGADSMWSLRVPMQYHYGTDSNRDGIPDQVADGIGIDRNGDGKADPLNDNNILDTDGNVVYDADDDLTDAGVVYVVFGGTHLKGTISLSEIGTSTLPGMVLVGHAAGYELGGGKTQNDLLSRGLSAGGDFDGDGYRDIMISSVLADPDGKTNAGEVYVVYGFAP
jgi:hypothetical protein